MFLPAFNPRYPYPQFCFLLSCRRECNMHPVYLGRATPRPMRRNPDGLINRPLSETSGLRGVCDYTYVYMPLVLREVPLGQVPLGQVPLGPVNMNEASFR